MTHAVTDPAWAAYRGFVPEPEVGVASENHRQTVRQERPILIHTASAALLSLGTFHPSIIKTSWPAGVSGVRSCTGSRSSAGARAIDVAPATKVLRSMMSQEGEALHFEK
jgi:hypothetical protein